MTLHAAILPILIPFAAALLQLFAKTIGFQRLVGMIAAVLGLFAAIWLVWLADQGAVLVYALGNWVAPFGIVLAVDRLAAIMVLLTALLSGAALLYATAGFDTRGRHFYPLFQLQIVGLQGAFLTGDLFNLFVFFEIMLLASYTLLAHGGGLQRTRAGLAYVVLNLLGSALFLIALGMLYGTLGTLNLADVALRLSTLQENIGQAKLAAALLITVFALKAALLPLSFWLPYAYASAGAPAAALFVIMTKVGIVALMRVQAIAFAPSMALGDLLSGWMTVLALATALVAALGVMAATRLRSLTAWLVLWSAGTLLVVTGYSLPAATAAALYYLLHSTLVVAALFLLADLIAERRGKVSDRLQAGPEIRATWLAPVFFLLAASEVGIPPFSGFLGKLMLLSALRETNAAVYIWIILLASGFLVLIALTRGGCRLFWSRKRVLIPGASMISGWRRTTALLLLATPSLMLVLFARPVSDYTMRTARQLHSPQAYISAVLGVSATSGVQDIKREQRP